MSRPFFYAATTKKLIVAFSTLFDQITVEDDFGRPYQVPLIFSQKEKFLEANKIENTDPVKDQTNFDITFPRMGFELLGIQFDPQRHTNPMNRLVDTLEDGTDVEMYNRIPYNFHFALYIGARKLEDSLKILEQILPYFTPELTVTVKDREDYSLETNIPFVLNSTNFEIDYEGPFTRKRTFMWELNFMARAFYYPISSQSNRIKQTILNLGESDYESIFERLTSTVTPMSASPDDPYVIVDTREEV